MVDRQITTKIDEITHRRFQLVCKMLKYSMYERYRMLIEEDVEKNKHLLTASGLKEADEIID